MQYDKMYDKILNKIEFFMFNIIVSNLKIA
jgi:hypothetical protein